MGKTDRKTMEKKPTFPTFSHRRLRLFGLIPSRRFWKLRRHGMEVTPGRSADLRAVRGLHLSKNGGVDHGKMVGLTMENCGFPIQPGKMVGLTMENHGK